MTCTTGNVGSQNDTANKMGIVSGHAYSILAAYHVNAHGRNW